MKMEDMTFNDSNVDWKKKRPNDTQHFHAKYNSLIFLRKTVKSYHENKWN